MTGKFISFEGGDGSGKSTQINLLKEYLEAKGYEVVLSREPGGTDIGEKIREIILDVENKEMTDEAEALLYAAARAQHVGQLVMPALKEGKVVILDRFIDSSLVYQGMARGLGVDEVRSINEFGTKKLLPDLSFYLDLHAEVGLDRKKEQAKLDRLETAGLSFHEKVRDGYLSLADGEKERFVVLDASESIEEIQDKIRESIDRVLIQT